MKKVTTLVATLATLLLTATNAEAQRTDRQQYVAKYKDWAIAEMERTGIPASITLAQGILESDCGNSDLAVEANNHFGIKCHSDWTGETMYKDDDRRHECFRSYTDAYQSFRDHSDFLTSKKRYASLFELDKTDYQGWAKGLKECGYATERTYAHRLIKIIEEEGLDAYDTADGQHRASERTTPTDEEKQGRASSASTTTRSRQPMVKPVFEIDPLPPHEVMYNNGVRYIELHSGDSFEGIANEFHLMVWELYKYNDLKAGDKLSDLSFLYLRPKRNRSHPDCPTYTAQDGDTMWLIAHSYGIKLRKLLKRNGMQPGDEPVAGTVIRLR